MLLFNDRLALHITRPMRWDSDHVVLSAIVADKLIARLGVETLAMEEEA